MMLPELIAWADAVSACNHADRPYETKMPDGRILTYCRECADAAEPLDRAYRAAYKAHRKATLDTMPRCVVDGCNRRGTWTFPFDVLVCGIHKRRIMTAHAKRIAASGSLALFVPAYSGPAGRDDLLAMASGKGDAGGD